MELWGMFVVDSERMEAEPWAPDDTDGSTGRHPDPVRGVRHTQTPGD